jgi:hypothetical protein
VLIRAAKAAQEEGPGRAAFKTLGPGESKATCSGLSRLVVAVVQAKNALPTGPQSTAALVALRVKTPRRKRWPFRDDHLLKLYQVTTPSCLVYGFAINAVIRSFAQALTRVQRPAPLRRFAGQTTRFRRLQDPTIT